MGCIFDTISFLLDFLFSAFIDFLADCYAKIFRLLFPKRQISCNARKWIHRIALGFSALTVMALFIGLICRFQADPIISAAGKAITHTALWIIGGLILLGILLKIIKNSKK